MKNTNNHIKESPPRHLQQASMDAGSVLGYTDL